MTTLTLTPVAINSQLYPGVNTFPGEDVYPAGGIVLAAVAPRTLTLTPAG